MLSGHDYKASVELAPFQKVSKPRRAKDSRQGTIAKDADFLEFCKQLESPPAPLPPADKQLELKEKEAKEQGAEKKQQPLAPIVEYLTDRKGYLGELLRCLCLRLPCFCWPCLCVTPGLFFSLYCFCCNSYAHLRLNLPSYSDVRPSVVRKCANSLFSLTRCCSVVILDTL